MTVVELLAVEIVPVRLFEIQVLFEFQFPVDRVVSVICPNEKIVQNKAVNNNDLPFILIRGWGNLIGIGGYNFDMEKASKIQDDFRDWIIYKLSTQTT